MSILEIGFEGAGEKRCSLIELEISSRVTSNSSTTTRLSVQWYKMCFSSHLSKVQNLKCLWCQ